MPFKFARRRSTALAGLGLAMVAAFAIGACATGRMAPVASPADLARGASQYHDLTAADLDQGRSLFTNRCGSCHRLPSPASQTAADWPRHIDEMRARAHLDDQQTRLVERYLVTMSLAAPPQAVSSIR